MATFMLYCLDKPGAGALRLEHRPAHLDWVRQFEDRIAMAGPLFADDGETFAGSVIVIEGESLAAVRAWSTGDPYARAGLFERVDIRPFKWILGQAGGLG
ncbi:MAG: YciI family protein [Pseudomonadota bacterium]